jgi:hypothetical protein
MTSASTVRNDPAASLEHFHSGVPAGRSGEWHIAKVVMPEREYDWNADPRPDCFKFRPGRYTSLSHGDQVYMTDLYDEWYTQRPAMIEALARGGDVLVTGLGLGMVAEAILQPGSPVRCVTIVELSSDVIRLVGPYLDARYPGRIELVEADAFAWNAAAGRRYSVGWHDIWPDPLAPEVAMEVDRLQARYAAVCDWQGSWPQTYKESLQQNRAGVA